MNAKTHTFGFGGQFVKSVTVLFRVFQPKIRFRMVSATE
jgi:hypothetical protein